jgi:hypothetical protein
MAIDVIVNCRVNSMADLVTSVLAASRWQHFKNFHPWRWNDDDINIWTSHSPPKIRDRKRYHTPLRNPRFCIPAFHIFSIQSPILTFRLPPAGTLTAAKLERAQLQANRVKEILEHLRKSFKGCGWFAGKPDICIVTDEKCKSENESGKEELNELVEPGTEHKYILPCANSQLLQWIEDGSIKQGKVVLIQSRFDPDRKFVKVNSRLEPNDWTEFFDSANSPPCEVLIFWCNNASSNSPAAAKRAFAWIKKNRPRSRVRVMLLENGINGFARFIESKGFGKKFTRHCNF